MLRTNLSLIRYAFLAKLSLTSGGKTLVMLIAKGLSPGWKVSTKTSGDFLSLAPLSALLRPIHLPNLRR